MMISGLSKVFGTIEKSKPLQKLGEWYVKDPGSHLAGLVISSIVIKDGVGCVKYVHQSKNNKKIPEDKRKFVTALDLTNGIFMILAQVGMFFAVKAVTPRLFDKIFKKSFNPQAVKQTISRNRMYEKANGLALTRKPDALEQLNASKDKLREVFKFIVETAAATIIGKRVIVPLIATPLAQVVEKRMDKKSANKPQQEVQNTAAEGQKLDIISTSDTNLLSKFKKA